MDPSQTSSTQGDARSSTSPPAEAINEAEDTVQEDNERRERRRRDREHRRSHRRKESQPVEEAPPEPRYYPLGEHLCNPELLAPLVGYLTFPEFYSVWHTSSVVGKIMEDTHELREIVLERFLGSVGYRRWTFEERREPITLTLWVSALIPYAQWEA